MPGARNAVTAPVVRETCTRLRAVVPLTEPAVCWSRTGAPGTNAARRSSQVSFPCRWLCRWTTGVHPPETASRSVSTVVVGPVSAPEPSILPIVTAISRDVFAQTPRDHIEAALALGATRWEVVRAAVLPYGRSGVGRMLFGSVSQAALTHSRCSVRVGRCGARSGARRRRRGSSRGRRSASERSSVPSLPDRLRRG